MLWRVVALRCHALEARRDTNRIPVAIRPGADFCDAPVNEYNDTRFRGLPHGGANLLLLLHGGKHARALDACGSDCGIGPIGCESVFDHPPSRHAVPHDDDMSTNGFENGHGLFGLLHQISNPS